MGVQYILLKLMCIGLSILNEWKVEMLQLYTDLERLLYSQKDNKLLMLMLVHFFYNNCSIF